MVISQTEEDLWRLLRKYGERVGDYEKKSAQEAARQVIPDDILQEASLVPARSTTTSLLRWFKRDFFSWVDTLDCPRCGAKTVRNGSVEPTEEDLAANATRVESHRCEKCDTEIRFARYNDPFRLLSERRGRCGEWANAFTLCCRAVGLDARLILDFTDHVWTEVWSPEDQKWVHADSCEETSDEPLLYEKGWGKKLNYVVAFHRRGVVDVTRRYSKDFAETLKRRTITDEGSLAAYIASLNDVKLDLLSPEERCAEIERQSLERVELKIPTGVDAAENSYLPRQSGAPEWIQERGEGGHAQGAATR